MCHNFLVLKIRIYVYNKDRTYVRFLIGGRNMRYVKDEDFKITSRFLFLSMAIIVIEQDIKRIDQGNFKIKEPYLELLRRMEHNARLERKQLQQLMKKNDLQVVFMQKNDTFSTYLFLKKGHEEERRYFNPAIRKKVELILHDLMHNVLAPKEMRKVD